MIKLTVRAVRDLAAMLETGLAGRPKALRVNNQDAVVVEPFTFAGDAALALAINAVRLKPVTEEYAAAYKAIFTAAAAGTGRVENGTPAMQVLNDGDDALLGKTVELDLITVNLSDLKPTDNKFSPGEIARLMPILKYNAPADAGAQAS